jgi:DNA-binding response OmpR family regulator
MTTPEVLIVDDDADIRESLALALELDGYEVAVARNGLEAWELLARHVPELVLLDLGMPVLDGAGLLALIRGDARLRDLPVIVVTAFTTLAAEVRALSNGWLHKPFELDKILDLASRHCRPRAAVGGV